MVVNSKNTESNNNSNSDDIALNKNTLASFDKIAQNAVKNYQFRNGKTYDSPYKTEKDYNNSFSDIIKFQSQYKEKDKQIINAVIFHDENNDGVISGYLMWKYLELENKKTGVRYYPIKPGHSRNTVDFRINNILGSITGLNVIVIDLSYNEETLKAIKNASNHMIVIDDHPATTKFVDSNVFVGSNHSAAAYTYKFLYPKSDVSRVVQYIDDSDRKLFLPYLSFTNLFTSALGFRFVHHSQKRPGPEMFQQMHDYFKSDNTNFWIFIGKYFEELTENLKEQIAQNAKPAHFQGYNIGVLNFNSPGLTKKVGRQIITNFKKQGKPIDFAVLWGYEYTAGPPAYNITMIDDHKQTQINLGELGKKLGDKGGHPKGGGGKLHVGHFYWPKDIMELFDKKII